MISVQGTLPKLVGDAKSFFQIFRFVHVVLAAFLLGTGVTALILSAGSDGTAQVPYFFSAFIAGAWHILLAVLCHICKHYLSGEGRQRSTAGMFVKVYSVTCSVFVLFNVMGIVFAVVNGICLEGQMCYYDKYMIANRFMAISIILEHCVSIIMCIFLAKKAHVFDTALNNDISIKLKHNFDFSKLASPRAEATVSATGNAREGISSSTLSSGSSDDKVFENKARETPRVFTEVNKSRSKSHPNLNRNHTTETEIVGTLVSIYSDSDMGNQDKKKLTSKFRVKVVKHNKVKPKESKSHNELKSYSNDSFLETVSDDESINTIASSRIETERQLRELKSQRENVRPLSEIPTDGDILSDTEISDSNSDLVGLNESKIQHEILEQQRDLQQKQELLQKQQRALLEQQVLMANHTSSSAETDLPPPPYSTVHVKEADETADVIL